MKNLYLIIIITAAMGYSCGQKNKTEVPGAVKNKFASLYPGVADAKWEVENGIYEAEFVQNKIETSVLFDVSGNLTATETEINPSELPASVQAYCTENMPGKTIKEATKIVSASGTITYETEIDNADYLFDDQGNYINKELEQESEEDDKD